MRKTLGALAIGALLGTTIVSLPAFADREDRWNDDDRHHEGRGRGHDGKGDGSIQLGPRPFYLVDGMDAGPLKNKLMQCKDGPFYRTDFSIGHRGAALQFPEHTKESYNAGARMGAGIVECDVTFTKDGHLVCRHAENDLHTTTNILVTPLAEKCSKPFTPATFDAAGNRLTAASAECRTSDLTLEEFKMLTGKMDASNPNARTPAEFLGGTAPWRTDLYTGRGTLMTLRESIKLNQRNGVKHTPELKESVIDPKLGKKRIDVVFGGQEQYAQKFADELEAGDVRPRDAWPQSFNLADVFYWIDHTRYGRQAVYLIDYDDGKNDPKVLDENGEFVKPEDRPAFFQRLRKRGVNIIAPAMPGLLAVEGNRVVPSKFARDLKGWGFDIITWTFERSDLRRGAAAPLNAPNFYYDFDREGRTIRKDSDMYKALDVLAKDVGIIGIFSDWPATVTYYANCMGLK
jgi:glycerophosphoryl diester phosphodiesterase